MEQINWKNLALMGEDPTESFENLCMYLLSRKLKVPQISGYQNQPGIESEPIEVNGKKIGFQAKFFGEFDWSQVKSSVKKAAKYHPEIDILYICSNKDRTQNGGKKSQPELKVEKIAKKHEFTVEFITDKDIKSLLSQPNNADLAQLFFGIGDEFSFMKEGFDPEISTLLQSNEYIELPFFDNKDKPISNIGDYILSKDSDLFLVHGQPGSGKSISMHKLLNVFGGLEENKKEDSINLLLDNKAIPILINLKYCSRDSIEGLIRGRKIDNKIQGNQLNFIFLLDGLDELNEIDAEHVLFQISNLCKKTTTHKIVISCRSGNINRSNAQAHFEKLTEISIGKLNESHIKSYFSKKHPIKTGEFKRVNKSNKKLIKEINDVLLIKLFWDSIENLDLNSSILDLLRVKMRLLLDSPKHKKHLTQLNLLNKKGDEIAHINEEIAYQMHQKGDLSISQKEFQELLLNEYSRINYKDTDEIIQYVSDLFFDNKRPALPSEDLYIYQHRRYQEYFLAKKIWQLYQRDPQIIRSLNIISNREFFYEIFLKFMLSECIRTNSLISIIEYNLIQLYSGKHNGFAPDEEYYLDSEKFLTSLFIQNEQTYNKLINEPSLSLEKLISVNLERVVNAVKSWKKNKNAQNLVEDALAFWHGTIAKLLENIRKLHTNGRIDDAQKLSRQLEEILLLYKEVNFFEQVEDDKNVIWDNLSNWIYYQIAIKDINITEAIQRFIRQPIENDPKFFSTKSKFSTEEGPRDKLIRSMIAVCIECREKDLFANINNLENEELDCLLILLTHPERLHILSKNQESHNFIKNYIESYSNNISKRNWKLMFYKNYFNLNLKIEELSLLKTIAEEITSVRKHEMKFYKKYIDYLVISYAIGTNKLAEYVESSNKTNFRYYDELSSYSGIYHGYIEVLKGKSSIQAILRDYIKYINHYFERPYGNYFEKEISELWALIFSHCCPIDLGNELKEILLNNPEQKTSPFHFYLKLNEFNPTLYEKIISNEDLTKFEETTLKWNGDYPSLVDRCFDLSVLFSKINGRKSIFYFKKGINESALRHGWRKDTIVSYQLTEAFSIIWNNTQIEKRIREIFARKVFRLTSRVVDITDGDHTWRGPGLAIGYIAEKDIDLAKKYFERLVSKNSRKNIHNWVITPILLAQTKMGITLEELEKEMAEFQPEYLHDGKRRADYHIQRFRVYTSIIENGLYTANERKSAFNLAYKEIEEANTLDVGYYEINDLSEETIEKYLAACKKHKKKNNLNLEKRDFKIHTKISEDAFIKDLKSVKNRRQLAGKYRKLNNYKNKIILKKPESWQILLKITCKYDGGVERFLGYLEKHNYPHMTYWSDNSKYMYYALAALLENPNTQTETYEYLFKNSGHSGFLELIKAFGVNGNTKKCVDLLDRYILFCELLTQ